MKILFIGDVQGQENIGRLTQAVHDIKKREQIDLTIVNGENSADTNGISPTSADALFNFADVITTGNHAFRRKEADSLFESNSRVLRPLNFGDTCPGRGVSIVDFGYCEVAVVNIMGMTFMPPCDNPFKSMDEVLGEISTPNIIVDFHAEATSEKKAMVFHLAGRVSAVIGTHTHVQTADERIVDDFTAYISDVGMVGAVDSIIGADKSVGSMFTDYYPVRHKYAAGEPELNAVIIEIDHLTGRAISINKIRTRF